MGKYTNVTCCLWYIICCLYTAYTSFNSYSAGWLWHIKVWKKKTWGKYWKDQIYFYFLNRLIQAVSVWGVSVLRHVTFFVAFFPPSMSQHHNDHNYFSLLFTVSCILKCNSDNYQSDFSTVLFVWTPCLLSAMCWYHEKRHLINRRLFVETTCLVSPFWGNHEAFRLIKISQRQNRK